MNVHVQASGDDASWEAMVSFWVGGLPSERHNLLPCNAACMCKSSFSPLGTLFFDSEGHRVPSCVGDWRGGRVTV